VSLDLHVDRDRWRAHLRSTSVDVPGLVPVAKGNGYGFGMQALAGEAAGLGVPLLAVATVSELPAVADGFGGRLLVLEPWRPFDAQPDPRLTDRLVRTVDRAEDVAALAAAATPGSPQPLVVELSTSMRRHGLPPAELAVLARALQDAGERVQVEGFAVHLPLPGYGDPDAEVASALAACTQAGLTVETLFVSHVVPSGLARLAAAHPGVRMRPRIGTALWLGDPQALRVTSAVIGVRPIRRGERFGYRQRRSPVTGHLVVCSGGTANGIATEPPSRAASVADRARALAGGGLQAAGLALSPFAVAGRRRWFAEPPHMQVSMLLLPAKVPPPGVGELLPVNAGMTLTRVDRVLWE